MTAPRPRIFSGMQPTHDSLHLGNYLGAQVNWVKMQEEFDAIFCVVDQHALTVVPDPAELRTRTRVTAAQYFAGGVDPERSTVFVQSQVPEHAQLAWVLNCFTGFGEASRMTQFKDKSGKRGAEGTNVGLFTYPMLMAADILLYDAQKVPVGEDQRQHLELTRDLAQRMNARYGDLFVVPEPHIPADGAKIMSLQEPTAKMSKSADDQRGNLMMLDEPKANTKKIKSAVTDLDNAVRWDPEAKPGIANLLRIHHAFSGESIEALVERYAGENKYGALKTDVAELFRSVQEPFKEKVDTYMADPGQLDAILAAGAERARELAAPTLERVYDAVGFLPARSSR
ncbi:tryptophan--tRNA ligase [Calidifontibacter indicus]|uniref:Tryptophan--tRNA ligase n=1 Tax=Calidifontibacter indicus TaxID=419650 RepID=A0A3D9UQX0_9MICO|nr:tryptophan--tRNA ligase [Calidifontibacter indicus]REF30380.1 tryptophanyl-tRNA synthetase [Calidifontibacter indicus]